MRGQKPKGRANMRLSQIEKAILAYLLKHPEAKDNERGILEWWLLEEEIVRRASTLRQALTRLVEAGLLLKRSGPGTDAYYTVNPNRLADIRKRVGGNGDCCA
jgi:predicted transcriptional regulator